MYHTEKNEDFCHKVSVPLSAANDGLNISFSHGVVPGAVRKHEAVAPFPLL